MNGTEVATSATVTGAYTRFTFNITSLIRSGTNSLAIEVNPNDPTTMFTLDNVDWTQIPPDNNTGIQFPVQLQVDGALAVGNSHVNQTDAADLSSAALTVKTDVTNYTATAQAGHGDRDDHPAGQRHADHRQPERHGPGEHDADRVQFTPGAFPALTISQPAGLVAVPARRAAALHAGATSSPRAARRYNTTTRDLRHQDRHVLPDRLERRSSRAGPEPSRSTACRSSSGAAATTRTCSCTTRPPTPPSRSR